jgi:hypothetical protein
MQTTTPTTATTIYESAPITVERKTLTLTVGHNDRGTFAKITETTAAGRADTIVMPVAALAPLRDAITEAMAHAAHG